MLEAKQSGNVVEDFTIGNTRIFVSIAAVVLDDWLRYWLFGEEHPHYTLFRRGESR